MQRQLAIFEDAVSDAALELGKQRQHRAEDFAEGSEIVVGDPPAEAQQLLVEYGGGIDHAEDGFGFERGFAVVHFDDDAS